MVQRLTEARLKLPDDKPIVLMVILGITAFAILAGLGCFFYAVVTW